VTNPFKGTTGYGYCAIVVFGLGAYIGGAGTFVWTSGDLNLGGVLVGVGLAALASAAALAAQDAANRASRASNAQLNRIEDAVTSLVQRADRRLTYPERARVWMSGRWPR